MKISRRAFTGGALGASLASQFAVPALAESRPDQTAALAAIQRFGEAHRAYFGLPGMTLGLVTTDGQRRVMNFGYANADARTAITPETLFQIGSISKVMVAILLHQYAAAGRLKLSDRISDLLPDAALPKGNAISVQHMLDHVAGLPGDSPLFPAGGLWTAYAPGAHWHYSNTAYDMLGRLAEHLGGKPLARLLADNVFRPLGMTRSRGAIVGADRLRYAQGYEPADQLATYVHGGALAPAPWVDVTLGAGCVASTADDMLPFLRALDDGVRGQGMLGLSPEQARTFLGHFVPSTLPGMTYGNGLMHLGTGGRNYLHHTGGMLSFSSSFHLDTRSGVGAFASSTLNAFAEYRPRLLTLFAVDALSNALAGKPVPAPPSLDTKAANPAAFAGRYAGPAGEFEIHADRGALSIFANGASAPLELAAEDVFHTVHPLFRMYSLMFERTGGAVTRAAWGPSSYERAGAASAPLPRSDPALARLSGRYVNDDPWFGPAPVVERGGKLWLGTETPMTRIGDNLWRVGRESWSPERAIFADFIDGRPTTLVFSGNRFTRHDI